MFRYYTFLLFLLVTIMGCRDSDKLAIVSKSISAHGGMDLYQKTRSLEYRKTTILFDSTDAEESRTIQQHKYSLQPEFTGEMEWEVNGELHRIVFDGKKAVKFINEVAQTDSLTSASALMNITAAHYVMLQPFKLLDPGTELIYLGRDTLEDGVEVDVIKANYPRANPVEPTNDQWWYYFDSKSALLVANLVRHGSTYSYIVNLDYNTGTGLRFNAHRKSFFVDSLRNILFLRAEYLNDDVLID